MKYFTAASIVLIAGSAALNAHAIRTQLNDWKVLPRPEPLSELYFTNHTSLPKTYTPGQQQTVDFTTHNLEYKKAKYSFTIVQVNADGSQSQMLGSGTFDLSNDTYKRQTLSVNLVDQGLKSTVNIFLHTPSADEKINYHLDRVST